ncbi:MAG: hypothetical protein ABIU29_06820 [Chthoniobacterales bacterium]
MTGRILQQMRALLSEHLTSESFPNFDGKFVDRSEGGDEVDARRAGNPDIELFANPVVRNISDPL